MSKTEIKIAVIYPASTMNLEKSVGSWILAQAIDSTLNLEKSVGSRILAQAIDSTALQENTRLTKRVKLRFF